MRLRILRERKRGGGQGFGGVVGEVQKQRKEDSWCMHSWSKEEEQELSSFDLKLDSICGELENKYFSAIEEFEKKRVAYEKDRKYQPRIVVDDDEEAGSDEEDL